MVWWVGCTWWVGVSEYTGRVVVTLYYLVPLGWDGVMLSRSDLVLIHYLVHPECPCLGVFPSVLVVMLSCGRFVLPITIYVYSAIASTGAIYMF